MAINIYPPEQQVQIPFTEEGFVIQKPIGFPHQDSVVRRVGPLFYWAWAISENGGGIGLHPHKGFEIMSYVVNGKLMHGDTLGTKSTVGAGGVQVMQTGSGISHEESTVGQNVESFQLWFEPFLKDAYHRQPTYHQYENDDFPVRVSGSVQIKTVIGDESPIDLITDVQMWDIQMEPGSVYQHSIPPGYSLAALAIRGDAAWRGVNDEKMTAVKHKDFTVIESDSHSSIELHANQGSTMRMVILQVPTTVDYPLYQ